MNPLRIFPVLKEQVQVWSQVKNAETEKGRSGSKKEKVLFIFSRFHADKKNIYHKAGSGLTQVKILEVLEDLGYDVYFGGQEDWWYPQNYIREAKAIIYIAPALPKFIKHHPTGKLILFANNSHVLVRNQRMRDSAKKWNLPVESLGPENYFLPAYQTSDYVMFSGNENCTKTFLENGVPREKIIHWSNSTDSEIFKPAQEKFQQFTFVHWSSEIGLRKGLPALLAAWKKWDNSKARLVLIGMVTKKVGTRLLFKRSWRGKQIPNLPLNVVLYASKKGYPAQDTFVRETLSKSHVGVFPTLEDGQPSVVIEMSASGLPLIITEESGYELDPSWSYKVKRDDVDSLVKAFEAAYTDPQLAQKSSNARQFTIDHHGSTQFKESFKEFLIQTIGYAKT